MCGNSLFLIYGFCGDKNNVKINNRIEKKERK